MAPESTGRRRASPLELLACPPDDLLADFIARPGRVDASLLRAVSRHLGRCQVCRDEAERRRQSLEASRAQVSWPIALVSVLALALAALVFVRHEMALPPPASPTPRSDPRLASLARFEPPSEAALTALGLGPASDPRGIPAALSGDDLRQLAAARASLDAGRAGDAVDLLEDLAARHPQQAGVRLLLAYAHARDGDPERARRQYEAADERGAGTEACWGLVNASLRLGDIAAARRELADHLLVRRPGDAAARELLGRLGAPEH